MQSSDRLDVTLRIGALAAASRANGPGTRAVVWLQGCDRGCPGCVNDAFAPHDGGSVITAREVATRLFRAGVSGVTFSGGEPILQARAVALLAREAQERGMSVLVFTGFTLEELHRGGDPAVADLLAHTDILVDGPFVMSRRAGTALWPGSDNQRVIPLTPRGKQELAQRTDSEYAVEVELGSRRSVVTGGVASDAVESIKAALLDQYGIDI